MSKKVDNSSKLIYFVNFVLSTHFSIGFHILIFRVDENSETLGFNTSLEVFLTERLPPSYNWKNYSCLIWFYIKNIQSWLCFFEKYSDCQNESVFEAAVIGLSKCLNWNYLSPWISCGCQICLKRALYRLCTAYN